MTNALQHETSPYLLQHSENPVDWHPWNEQTLALAKKENKLILVSIGYSACHWCHVMERECFEDHEVAEVMNRYFINIKVDREERPDVDQVYMTAVQVATGSGGWPLNCFTLPDGRPLYGGTYFPKSKWLQTLEHLADLWMRDPLRAAEYAGRLTEGVKQSELILPPEPGTLANRSFIHTAVRKWQSRFDTREGGPDHSPKFPLPNNYSFLLRFGNCPKENGISSQDGEPPDPALILKQVRLTLDKMARGGIYDQIGGGFCRYSTDAVWKVPHFEKMLYDNAQLISLYAEALRFFPAEEYEELLHETISFCERELLDPSGGYYSALDADSEGVEGKYYLWSREEVESLLGPDAGLCMEYFHLDQSGAWEGAYIPLRAGTPEQFAAGHGISPEQLRHQRTIWKNTLLHARQKRIRPGLDDKIITSWNAMMIQGLIRAGEVTGDANYISRAVRCAGFLRREMLKPNGGMYHTWKNGTAAVNAFLDDLSFTALAFTELYECTLDETWLNLAGNLTEHALGHYSDEKQCFFYFTSDEDTPLIVRKTEINDNVIPSSNAVMGEALRKLAIHLGKREWADRALRMYLAVQKEFSAYPPGYSCWMMLGLSLTGDSAEVSIVGNSVNDFHRLLRKRLPPHLIFAGSRGSSTLPLLIGRHKEEETLVYVCRNASCREPVKTAEDALRLLQADN
ncbi:MAG: thioredoxin domain-containing protein [Bacteroidia bacterium]|nr:thioredoxin domain-containing protein [Bacteroidia bacterium]